MHGRAAVLAGVHHRGGCGGTGVLLHGRRPRRHGRRAGVQVRRLLPSHWLGVRSSGAHFRVLQLMQLRDSRLPLGSCSGEKLELALLSFFEQFRKIYVGDQVPKTSKVYRRLSEVLGLSDDSMVLSIFVRKIITNLRYWSCSEPIVSKTLQLLSDLSVGYSSVRKLVKLEEVQFMLSNHTSEHFPFLGHGSGSRSPRTTTTTGTGPTGMSTLLGHGYALPVHLLHVPGQAAHGGPWGG
ncbi:unnamed protein product [Ixodes hexagonus]